MTSNAQAPPQIEYLPGATNLEVGSGQSVKLSVLGPIVVNLDGSISRIDNWSTMSEIERERTYRLIGKRNLQRIEQLKARGVTDAEALSLNTASLSSSSSSSSCSSSSSSSSSTTTASATTTPPSSCASSYAPSTSSKANRSHDEESRT